MESFPVPIRFDLPGPQWRAVVPSSVGVTNALFVALRDETPGDFTPVISFSGGWRTDDADMEKIADEAVMLLREETGDAQLLDRREVGGTQTPGISQVVRSSAQVDGRTLNIARLQAVLAFVDAGNAKRRAVLIVSCTSLAEQVEVVTPEFKQLVQGLRVDTEKLAG